MDTQVQHNVEQALRQNWKSIRRTIQDRFPTLSQVDLDSAHSVHDLTARIADKTGYSERYVETELINQVLRGNGDSLIGAVDFGQPGQYQQPREQVSMAGSSSSSTQSRQSQPSFGDSAR